MSFSVAKPQAGDKSLTEPYDVNASISMAANLREAFNTSILLKGSYEAAVVMVDSPVLLIPTEEIEPTDTQQPTPDTQTLYRHTFASVPSGSIIVSSEIEDLSVVAVYTVSKDLKTVLDDHFQKVTFIPTGLPVWRDTYRRAFPPKGRKLFAYFHDAQMEVFSFRQNRFNFHNTFCAAHAHDALYYLLFAWKQLAMDAAHDEMELIGDMPHGEWLTEHLKQHLTNVTTTRQPLPLCVS